MARVAVFIEGGYLDEVLRKEFSMARLDYGKLSSRLAAPDDLLRTYYYHCMPYQSNLRQRMKRNGSARCNDSALASRDSIGSR